MDEAGTLLSEIIRAKDSLRQNATLDLPREIVLSWMNTRDIECQGVIYSLIFDAALAARIKPSLSIDDYLSFVLPYYSRCLIENPGGEWSDSRYSAGWDLAGWIKSLWMDKPLRPIVDEIRDWLGRLYKSSDEDVRRCIVDATLEHVFETRSLARRFDAWRRDPELKVAYDEAHLWKKELDRKNQGTH